MLKVTKISFRVIELTFCIRGRSVSTFFGKKWVGKDEGLVEKTSIVSVIQTTRAFCGKDIAQRPSSKRFSRWAWWQSELPKATHILHLCFPRSHWCDSVAFSLGDFRANDEIRCHWRLICIPLLNRIPVKMLAVVNGATTKPFSPPVASCVVTCLHPREISLTEEIDGVL